MQTISKLSLSSAFVVAASTNDAVSAARLGYNILELLDTTDDGCPDAHKITMGDVFKTGMPFTQVEIADQCQHYPSTGLVPFEMIAQAWSDAGMTDTYCPEAVIIAGGEAQPTGQADGHVQLGSHGECSWVKKEGSPPVLNEQGSGPSGVFQCDSCRGAGSNAKKNQQCDALSSCFGDKCSLNLRNPCINVWSSVITVMFPHLGLYSGAKWNPGCLPQKIKGSDSEPQQAGLTQADGKCNFIGPFCHRSSSGGVVYNGGGNAGQLPFPDYYFNQFLLYSGLKQSDIPREPTALKNLAYDAAQKVCDNKKGPN